MARLTGALFSLAASGTIADTLTFAKWKGVQYVRTRVIPANPKSAAQREVRGIFSTLNEMWKRMPQGARLPWNFAARGQPLTPRNIHIGKNVAVLQDTHTLDDLVMSIATGSALPPDAAIAADGADGTITWTADAPTAPPGYSLAAVYGVATLEGDPSPVIIRPTYFGQANAAPWAGVINVPTDDEYQVGLFCLWSHVSGMSYCSDAVRSQVNVTGN